MSEIRLEVSTAPTTHSLCALLALVHAKGARVSRLVWSADGEDTGAATGTASFVLAVDAARRDHLRAALQRGAYVTSVHESH